MVTSLVTSCVTAVAMGYPEYTAFWMVTASLLLQTFSGSGAQNVAPWNQIPALCNVTLNGTYYQDGVLNPIHLTLVDVTSNMIGRPMRCFYRFQGLPGQRVSINIQGLRTGVYDKTTYSCRDGWLRIWDGSRDPGRHRYPPNTFCGYYEEGDLDVDKVSTGTMADMEFYTEQAHQRNDFVVGYKYVNIVRDRRIYPRQLDHSMHLVPHSASVCYWKIILEDCQPECHLLSPGYPGVYPPFMECYYHVTSHNPDVAIQLKVKGNVNKALEFDIRQTPDCHEDYLDIFDADSAKHRTNRIGRYCGDTVPEVTTLSNNLFLVFVSGAEPAPYGHIGFHFAVFALTKEWHRDSTRVGGAPCDWVYNTSEGSISSPDHWLPRATTCTYTILLDPGCYLEVMLNIYGLLSGCREQITVHENNIPIARICESSIRDLHETFTFNLTGESVVVKYRTTEGQTEARSDRGFWLSFRQVPDPDAQMMIREEEAQPVIRVGLEEVPPSDSGANQPVPTAVLSLVVPWVSLLVSPWIPLFLSPCSHNDPRGHALQTSTHQKC